MGWVRVFHLFVTGYTPVFELFRGSMQPTLFDKEKYGDEN
jgi:hypothetical protein